MDNKASAENEEMCAFFGKAIPARMERYPVVADDGLHAVQVECNEDAARRPASPRA